MGRTKHRGGGKNKRWKAGKKVRSRDDNNNDKKQSGAGYDGNNFVKTVVAHGNVKMESYYAAQGLHNLYWKKKKKSDNSSSSSSLDGLLLVPCTTLEEWNAQRLLWRDCMGRILPASFRFTKDVSESLKLKMQGQLVEMLQTALQEEAAAAAEDDEKKVKATATAATAAAAVRVETCEETKEATGVKEEAVKEGADDINKEESKPKGEGGEETGSRRPQEPPPPLSELLAQHNPTGATGQGALFHKLTFSDFAFQLGVDRNAIRKHPRFKALHQWMKDQQDCGHLTRQETVSMIPPVVLDIQKHHAVLDLCAAPGSKTSQLLEKLGPSGLLIANDANPDRAFMLTHQLKRLLHNTHPITLVTACQAQFFPSSTRGCKQANPVTTTTTTTSSSSAADPSSSSSAADKKSDKTEPAGKNKKAEALVLFDRILADVPCTGDGTTRKNIHVWRQWTQQAALSLHPLQLEIAWKGAKHLLKAPCDYEEEEEGSGGGGGGYICYSTCSLNPIEDEAVVAELLRRSKGSLELVDVSLSTSCSSSNGGDTSDDVFRTRPGLSHWKVFCEHASKREMKNWAKKNNEKMQQRRREYEQQSQKKDGEEKDKKKEETVEKPTSEESKSTPSASDDKDKSTNDMELDKNVDEEAKKIKKEDTMDSSTQPQNGSGHQVVKDATATAAAATTPTTFEPTSMKEADLIAMAEAAGLKYMPTLADVPDYMRQRVRPTCFPPTPEEAKEFHLERCMRCLPQDNDTGGFFVALLRKVGPISNRDYLRQKQQQADFASSPDPKRAKLDVDAIVAEKEKDEDDDDDAKDGENAEMINVEGLDADNIPVTKPSSSRKFKVDDRFVPVDDEILDPLIEYYGLKGPDFRKDLFMTRLHGDCKVIHYLSAPVKNLLDRGLQDRVQVIASGLKAFSRNSKQNQCDVSHRVAQDAVYFLSQHMTKRKFIVNEHDFLLCLNLTKPAGLSEFSDKFAQAVRPIDVGAFVVILEGYENKGVECKMAITMWRCRGDNVSLLVAKMEVDSLKDKLHIIKEEKDH